MRDSPLTDDEMPAEIDFSKGMRGLHHIPVGARTRIEIRRGELTEIASSRKEVVEYIDNFVHDRGRPFDWDDFISIPIRNDSGLEEIRVRCCRLQDEFPPTPGQTQYCSDAGIKILQQILSELQSNDR